MGDEAKEAAPAGPAERKRKTLLGRLFSRIPSSLFVTVFGIALTAWLLPAFTRQWDDRKDARALTADLAEKIVVANDSFINAVFLPVADPTPEQRTATFRRLSRKYDIDGTSIAAEFQIYFSPRVQRHWYMTMSAVASSLDLLVQAYDNFGHREIDYAPYEKGIEGAVKFGEELGIPRKASPKPRLMARQLVSDRIAVRVVAADHYVNYARGLVFRFIEELRNAHVDGYSTTYRDLISNLFP